MLVLVRSVLKGKLNSEERGRAAWNIRAASSSMDKIWFISREISVFQVPVYLFTKKYNTDEDVHVHAADS
jgi:hypothetical protein